MFLATFDKAGITSNSALNHLRTTVGSFVPANKHLSATMQLMQQRDYARVAEPTSVMAAKGLGDAPHGNKDSSQPQAAPVAAPTPFLVPVSSSSMTSFLRTPVRRVVTAPPDVHTHAAPVSAAAVTGGSSSLPTAAVAPAAAAAGVAPAMPLPMPTPLVFRQYAAPAPVPAVAVPPTGAIGAAAAAAVPAVAVPAVVATSPAPLTAAAALAAATSDLDMDDDMWFNDPWGEAEAAKKKLESERRLRAIGAGLQRKPKRGGLLAAAILAADSDDSSDDSSTVPSKPAGAAAAKQRRKTRKAASTNTNGKAPAATAGSRKAKRKAPSLEAAATGAVRAEAAAAQTADKRTKSSVAVTAVTPPAAHMQAQAAEQQHHQAQMLTPPSFAQYHCGAVLAQHQQPASAYVPGVPGRYFQLQPQPARRFPFRAQPPPPPQQQQPLYQPAAFVPKPQHNGADPGLFRTTGLLALAAAAAAGSVPKVTSY